MASHLPWLEGHPTSPPGAPALSEDLRHPHRPAQCTVHTGWRPCSTAASWSWVPASCFSLELPPGHPPRSPSCGRWKSPAGQQDAPPDSLGSRPGGGPGQTPSGGPAALEITASPPAPWQTQCVKAPSLHTPCSPPPPATALGLPEESPRGGGCAWLSPGVCRLVLPGATHAWPQA